MNCQEIIDKRKALWEKNIKKSHEFASSEDKEYIESVTDVLTSPGKPNAYLRRQVKNRPDYLIEMVFTVVDKNQKRMPFFLNTVQDIFRQKLVQAKIDYEAGLRHSLKFLVLKGRQQGFTTFITAYQLACAITQDNFFGFTLADSADNSGTIFLQKAKVPFNNLPQKLKPHRQYDSKVEFYFDKLNSQWKTATAGKGRVGHSKTLNFFHGSECAFWEGMDEIMGGLGEALTDSAIQIMETTANGFNDYRELWVGDNNWECCFFEWWLTPEYEKGFTDDLERMHFEKSIENAVIGQFKEETEEWVWGRCKWLRDVKQLPIKKIHWYYLKWKDRKRLICQEYPCTDLEAFLASGNCVFDTQKLIMRKDVLEAHYKEHPFKRGYFEFEWKHPESKDRIIDNSIRFVEKPDGVVYLWGEEKLNGEIEYGAMKGYPYVMGGDTSGEGKDRFSATVKNNNTHKRVAMIWGDRSMDEEEYSQQIYCLGRYFNNALVGIEINFNTYPIRRLQQMGYNNQYKRRKYDDETGAWLMKLGWKTDGSTRPNIITRYQDLVKNMIWVIFSIECIQECLTFIDDGKKFNAQDGKHDDILMSDMICEEISQDYKHEVIMETKPKEKRLSEKLGLNKPKLRRRGRR